MLTKNDDVKYNAYCYFWEPAQMQFDTKKPKLILIIISTVMLTKNDDVKYNAYCYFWEPAQMQFDTKKLN